MATMTKDSGQSDRGGGGRRSILITGCSSGIGRATAVAFARKGWRVFATMRDPSRAPQLAQEAAAQGWALTTPALDVNSDASVDSTVASVLTETGGRLDALVNNAGYYCWGPVEETSPDELRAQLETNVVGVLRVTRAALPAMRARGDGIVVNISSVSGRVVLPAVGPYHASKWALEALCESLRYELIPFGVRVVLIEPGPFATDLHAKEVRSAASRDPKSPYAALTAEYTRQSARLSRGDPGRVVQAVEQAVDARNPRLRWPVGPSSLVGTLGRHLTPDRLYELIVRIAFKLRRKRTPAYRPSSS